MVVVITSTGGVSKHRYVFPAPVDPRARSCWAGDYLRRAPRSACGSGRDSSARALDEPSLSPRERALPRRDPRRLRRGRRRPAALRRRRGGPARRPARRGDRRLPEPDRRAREARRAARRPRAVARPAQAFVRVGDELEPSGLHDLALVGATYGLTNQTLGAVSLLGPLRMDYEKALRTVRSAAHELSRFVEEVYEAE